MLLVVKIFMENAKLWQIKIENNKNFSESFELQIVIKNSFLSKF